MTTYKRFEDLPVWNDAIVLAEKVYDLTRDAALRRQYSLRDQLERAALSVSNNIAEGFERGTTNELLSFLYIARGSAGEARSMLCFIERLNVFDHLKSEILNLKSASESVSRQIRAWAEGLQNSDIKGHRHLNQKVKIIEQQRKEREAFWEEHKHMIPEQYRVKECPF